MGVEDGFGDVIYQILQGNRVLFVEIDYLQ